MAESNSKPSRCPCGFYGTSETLGLCSKCYNEHLQRKTAEADGTAPSESKSTAVSSKQLSQALGNVVTLPQMTASSLPVTNSSSSSSSASNEASKTPDSNGTIEPATKNTITSDSQSDVSGSEAPKSVEIDKTTDNNSSDSSEPSSSNATKRVRENSECDSTTDDKPAQKNKKRCFTCNCKLQPAIREIGRCKCELVFCQLHRLPEQHDCIYDHKASGRKEAREKMVSPKKHMGTSLKRIDSDS